MPDSPGILSPKLLSMLERRDDILNIGIANTRYLIRNHFISTLVLDSLKFKKLLQLHVLSISNHFISTLVLDSLKFKKLLQLHVLSIRNHFISNLVLESLKFKKLLQLHVFNKKPLYKQPSLDNIKFKNCLELHGKS